MNAKRVYLLCLLFIALTALLASGCNRKSGCNAIDKTINKKVKKKNKSHLFDKQTRRQIGTRN